MCGITGFITTEKIAGALDRKRWFLNAIRAGVVRGDDGTGMFLVEHEHKGPADWCKMAGPPEGFLASEHATNRFNANWEKYRAVIGHNRSATIGNVSTANSHPFQEGPITLVHNGTLHTTHGLPMPKHKTKGADVDSHIITHNLATHSVQEVVRQLDGAYVLVWHDARDNSVNIVRNDRRPLHILPIKYQNTLFLASEAEMLWWLTERSTFSPLGPIYYPEPGHWMQFTEGSLKPKITKLTMHSYATRTFGGRGGVWDDGDYDGVGWHRQRQTNRPNQTEGPNTGKAPSPPQKPDKRGPYINPAALNRRIPAPLARTLDQLELDPRDKLRFEVVVVDPVHGLSSAVVKGRLPDLPGKPWCHLYGLSYEAVAEAREREFWTVAPNGMKDIGGGLRPVVLARLLARSSINPQEESTDQTDSKPPSDKPSSTDSQNGFTEERDPPKILMGPDNEPVAMSEWLTLTRKGCCVCNEPFMIEFADEVWWDTVTKEPVCGPCTAEYLDELDEGDELDYSKAV